MLVTNLPKVILHMPRCGGSSIRWAIVNAGYTYKYSCEHAPIWSLPKIYKHMPKVAFVRNPLHWYKSWYYQGSHIWHNRRVASTSIIAWVLSEEFTQPFEVYLKRALNVSVYLRETSNAMNILKNRIRHVAMNKYSCWLVLTFQDVDALTPDNFEGSHFRILYDRIGLNEADEVYRIEDGLQVGFDTSFPNSNVVIGHRNKVPSPTYEDLYTDEMKRSVFQADSPFMEKYNYTI